MVAALAVMMVVLPVPVIVAAALMIVIMVMVVMLVIMAVAFLAIVMMVLMVVVMTAALAVLTVLVVVLMVVIVASAGAVLAVIVVMMVLMGGTVLVDVHHDAGFLEGVERPVLKLVVVDVQNGGHEAEIHCLAGPHLTVEEHSLLQIREVHGEGLIPVADSHLDVSHQRSGFPLDPSADLHEHVGESGFHIGVESPDLSVETYGLASRLLGGVELTH